MKKNLLLTILLAFATIGLMAQGASVPKSVKLELTRRYPEASKVAWQKQQGKYSARWKDKLGQDNNVLFTPGGAFVEILTPTPVSFLPGSIKAYVKDHHKTTITQAHKSMNAVGKLCYKVDIKGGGELIFDQDGKPVKP